MLAQASQPAIRCDVEPLHDPGRPHLAHSRQCLQDVDDFSVGNDVVALGKIEHLSKALLAGAQRLLDLGAAASSFGRGKPCLLTLLIA